MTLLRCSVVQLLATVGLAGLLALTLPGATAGASWTTPFDDLLVTGCAVLAAAAGTWLWIVTTAVVVEAARGRDAAVPGVPVVVRRAVLAACGLALVGSAAPAAASPAPLDDRGALHGLPMPERATSTAAWVAALGTPAPPPQRPGRTVVVRAGDTLWGLAAAGLPATAGSPAVAARAQRIHDLNRAVIGDDPDLIHPGQRLHLPPPPHRGAS